MLINTEIDDALLVQVLDASESPVAPDAAPTYRIYDGSVGLVSSGVMTLALTGDISNVTNVNPAVITSSDHGLTDGTRIAIAGVLGATGANGNRTVTRINDDTFSVALSGAPGVYTDGGAWTVIGLYKMPFDSSLRSQLEPGRHYTVAIDYELSSTPKTLMKEFNAT